MALRDQPYLPLYVQDVLTDEKLIECSPHSQGVYFRLLCVLHKQDDYGKFLLKQKYNQADNQIKNFALALVKPLALDFDSIFRGLTELIKEGVLFIEGDYICQKRMIKDGNLSDLRSEIGRKGGKKTQSKSKNFAKAKIKANNEIENEDEIEYEYNKKSEKIDFSIPLNNYGYCQKVIPAKDIWDRLSVNSQNVIMDHIEKYIENHEEFGKREFLPDFYTYLKDERYLASELPYNNKRNGKQGNDISSGIERMGESITD